MQRRITWADWVLTATMVVGLAVFLGKSQLAGVHAKSVGLASVVVASSSFLLVAVRSVCFERSRLAVLLCTGLALCWIGDVVGYVGHFVPSAVAFLVGHLVFAAGFVSTGIRRRRLEAAIGCVAFASGLLAWWLLPHVAADMQVLVIGYMAVISIMVATACGTRHPNAGLLAVAAVLFYVSDIAVAHWKFISDGPWHAFLCYPLYYPACLLLAFGSRVARPASAGETEP
jgi:uncharacterized membrane protein YhhN